MINDQQQRKRTHTHSKIVPIESLFYWTGVCKLEFEPFDATGVLSILRNMGRARRACRPRPEGLMRGRCARIPLTFGARSAPTGAPQALDASAGAIHAHLPLCVLIYASMCEACVVRAMGGSTASDADVSTRGVSATATPQVGASGKGVCACPWLSSSTRLRPQSRSSSVLPAWNAGARCVPAAPAALLPAWRPGSPWTPAGWGACARTTPTLLWILFAPSPRIP